MLKEENIANIVAQLDSLSIDKTVHILSHIRATKDNKEQKKVDNKQKRSHSKHIKNDRKMGPSDGFF